MISPRTRRSLECRAPLGLLLHALLAACGARTDWGEVDDGWADGSTEVHDDATVRAVATGTVWDFEPFPCLEDPIGHRACEVDEDCCFGKCVQGITRDFCYRSAPPNAPCGPGVGGCASGVCMPNPLSRLRVGLQTFDCPSSDVPCTGVCGLSGPGDSCRWDSDCLTPPCVPPLDGQGGHWKCFECETDTDCRPAFCANCGARTTCEIAAESTHGKGLCDRFPD